MAVQLAPYNNAMRLGQGFNSYTQRICLNDAVMRASEVSKQQSITPSSIEAPQPSEQSGSSVQIARETTDSTGRSVSQIVSYSSRFVDKLSDITDAMNISASLSIKTATIGGSASGSFIDSDKFKQSDMNFFIQVKVVNQVISGEDYTEFQDIKLPAGISLTEVYGDTFISGFEEGGELNALISVKALDKSKTFAIRAELEGTMGTPALTGNVKGGISLENAQATNSTETTVTVNWSGGGQIKPSNAIWDVNSLTLAATNFPDLVANTPQRTYAILTKYTTLKSFIKIHPPASVLTYENAGVYTATLLDTYMDYKSIWKQIQVASFELKSNRAVMRVSKPSKEVLDLAEKKKTKSPAQAKSNSSQDPKHISNPPDLINFTPYSPTPMGLDKARRDCRNEMIKIVSEVDQVTTNPDLALDMTREERFVSPRVFTQLLPVVALRPVQSSNPEAANPKDLIILGESDEVLPLQQWIFNRAAKEGDIPPYPAMLASIDRHKAKSNTFDMGDTWSGIDEPRKSDIFFNCLDRIDGSWIPKSLCVWVDGDIMTGLRVLYTNGSELSHGHCPGNPKDTIDIKCAKAQCLIQIIAESAIPGNWRRRVTGLQVVLDTSDSGKTSTYDRSVASHSITRQTTLVRPNNGFWSFRGFWGSVAPDRSGFLALGAVWGLDSLDSALGPLSSPFDYQMFTGEPLPDDAIITANRHRSKLGSYCMSALLSDQPVDKEKHVYWNDLENPALRPKVASFSFDVSSHKTVNSISNDWTVSRVTGHKAEWLAAEAEAPLFTRVQLWYSDDKELEDYQVSYLVHVELHDKSGNFMKLGGKPHIVESDRCVYAPNDWWSVAGFWGYRHKTHGVITHLGIIWAKQPSRQIRHLSLNTAGGVGFTN